MRTRAIVYQKLVKDDLFNQRQRRRTPRRRKRAPVPHRFVIVVKIIAPGFVRYNFEIDVRKISLVLDVREKVPGAFRPRARVVQVNAAAPQVHKLLAFFLEILDCLAYFIKGFAASPDPNDKIEYAIIG